MDQNPLITMTSKEVKRYEIIKDLIAKKIDGTEASKLLFLSVRQIKRLKLTVGKIGIQGIIHGNRGKTSHHKTEENILVRTIKLLHEKYHDFNPLLAQEHLRDDHKIKFSKETVRRIMISEKLWHSKKVRGTKKHFWRERKNSYGEMEQFDGSYHDWFEHRNSGIVGIEQCLLVAVDDATGAITGACFEDNEGVEAVFRFWKGYFETNGQPVSIYLDRFSTYKVNHKNAVDNKDFMTQFERAMNQLGIRVIHANSPQAKGRVEKMNGTLQRRLVKELRLNTINTIPDANKFLKDKFIPKFNLQFAVIPKKENDLHQKLNDKKISELNKILSVQNERIVNNDYTVQFKNSYYQLNDTQPTTVYKKDRVMIEEHLSGEIKISLRNHYLNYFRLPERPKKQLNVTLPAITIKKQSGWIPPENHPWKTRNLFTKKQPMATTVK